MGAVVWSTPVSVRCERNGIQTAETGSSLADGEERAGVEELRALEAHHTVEAHGRAHLAIRHRAAAMEGIGTDGEGLLERAIFDVS